MRGRARKKNQYRMHVNLVNGFTINQRLQQQQEKPRAKERTKKKQLQMRKK